MRSRRVGRNFGSALFLITGWAYDAGAGSGNGNITTDPSNAKMTLDGENRMVSYTSGSGAAVRYTYDGDGRRVTKNATSGAPTTYVYDAAGQLTAAYSSVANSVTGTEFLTADHLGSIRMITNSTGNAVARHDTEPFGEELLGGSTGCRLSSLGYGGTSGVTLEFTGKERDAETGLDYFGARYFSGAQGRFTSPDPLTASAKVWDPQSWNRYSYARNNPLSLVDPTGMAEVSAAACARDKNCVTVNVNVIYDSNANGGKGLTDKQKATFEKNKLQNARDQYGNADIRLNVTYTSGEIDSNGHQTGLAKGALNVFVTDEGGAASMDKAGYAVSRVNVNSTDNSDLPHEMAHQFMGDMSSVLGRTLAKDPTGISVMFDNLFTDATDDTGRFIMNNSTPHLPRYPSGAPATVFNPQARDFQNRITPQTQPQ